MDPLDTNDAAEQAWAQFRIGFSAATALRMLIMELPEVAPDYLETLRGRVSDAVSQGEVWSNRYDGEGEWDGFVPIQGPPGSRSVTFVPADIAAGLEDQLSADVASDADQLWLVRGAIVVMLSGALEALCRARGFDRGSLLSFLRKRFPDMAVDIYLPLTELTAARNAFAHSAGIADQQYRERIAGSPTVEGERIPLLDAHLEAYSRAVWRTGVIVHRALT